MQSEQIYAANATDRQIDGEAFIFKIFLTHAEDGGRK